MFKAVLTIILGLTFFFGIGFVVGHASGRNDMADTIQPPQTNEFSKDHLNEEILRSYMDGSLSGEDAEGLFFPTELKTITIPMNISKWGTIQVGEYDPAEDPHAGKDSPFGLGSCVIASKDGSFGCGEDSKSHFKCTIYVQIEKGPLAGTTFYSKSCDGRPIAERKGNKLIIHYETILHVK